METMGPECARSERAGMISELTEALNQKIGELNNLEVRLGQICDRVLGGVPQTPERIEGANKLAPVQAGLHEVASQVMGVGNAIDRIRDHIVRLEDL